MSKPKPKQGAKKKTKPPWSPTEKQRAQVKIAKAAGLTHAQIAGLIGIDEKTMVKHLGVELATANAEAITTVANNLYRRAVSQEKEAVTAAIFWLKTRAGWRDVQALEHSGPDGGPIPIQRREPATAKELEQIAARLKAADSNGAE